MKSLALIAVAIVSLFTITSYAQSRGGAMVVQPDYVFIPPGFDSNDNAEIVLAGQLPSTCYTAAASRYALDRSRKIIKVYNMVRYTPDENCLQMMVDYAQTIRIGSLPAGNWQVIIQGRGESFDAGALPIVPARNPAIDDQMYLPVKIVTELPGNPGEQRYIQLAGRIDTSCVRARDVKILSRRPGVIEVLPLATNLKRICEGRFQKFSTRVNIGTVSRKTLVHVRALNGLARNIVVDPNQ